MTPSVPDFSGGKETIVNLKVQLFGPFTVQVENVPLPPLRTRKGAWLFALLVLRSPQPVERVWLASTLWPDSEHNEALRNLRNSLHDLRKALGAYANLLHSPTPSTLALDLAGAEVDLFDFDALIVLKDAAALEKAVGLYRACLMDGCYEEWVLPERDQREQRCLEALEILADIDLREGAFASAIRRLRVCLGMDPLRETAQRALMTALAAAGDYASATMAYREFRIRLHEQLQTSPSAETTGLYEQIRIQARQSALRPRVSPVGSAPNLTIAATTSLSTNLPEAMTSFIGRGQEMDQIHTLLQSTRLLTLTGAGGCGKTRLALQIARELQKTFADGVWLVELASLADPSMVPDAVAAVFSLHEQTGVAPLQTIIGALASRNLLLVLDNCEHLLAASAQLAYAVLRSCPGIRLLATSRERFGIAGEQTFRVPSLTLPDSGRPTTMESVGESEAMQLFVERARLNRPDFVLNAQNAPKIVSLCHSLDGIPLALELAAARVRSLSVEDIESRLERRFELLTGGDRSALPRHQTLRAMIDWSYDLLKPHEKLLLQRLSVFPGGWTLDAAEAIGAGGSLVNWEVLDLLTSLVDKSLVIAEDRDGVVRYRMLDTLRHYALEKLETQGELEWACERRRHWFTRMARTAAQSDRNGAEHEKWLNRLAAEQDNLRAALTWSRGDREGVEEGLDLAGFLWRFWAVRSHISEGREHLRRALERKGAEAWTVARTRALNAAGNLADNQADYKAAYAFYQEALTIRKDLADREQNLSDRWAVGILFSGLGHVAKTQGDIVGAHTMYAASLSTHHLVLERRREQGDKPGVADSLADLGLVASDLGDYDVAMGYLQESLAIQTELADRLGIATALFNLAVLAQRRGDEGAAQTLYSRSLTLKLELGDRRGAALSYFELAESASRQGVASASRAAYASALQLFSDIGDRQHVALCLEGLAVVSHLHDNAVHAVRLWGAAAALRVEICTPIALKHRDEYDRHLHQARTALGEDLFATVWEEGEVRIQELVALPHGLESVDI